MTQSLDRLPHIDAKTGGALAVVETPGGSRTKYDYDPELGVLRLKKVLPLGMVFPFDFGFIPQTKAEDGDPLDVLILSDEPAPAGCVVDIRIIGAIEVEQREDGGNWVRNDRVLGVATASETYAGIATLGDLPPKTLDELEAFFTQYNKVEGKELRVLRRTGPDEARQAIDQASLSPDLCNSAKN